VRITSSMYYNDIFSNSNSKLSGSLFDVNKQIASGLNIQYASDDIRTFTETMRLDNEIVTLGQVKSSTESAYKFSDQSDVIMNEFETSINRMRTLLVQAANGTNDETSLEAISKELRGIEDGLKDIANTSINGQYLFSGSAVDIRPISDDGTYNGNNESMNAFTGSRTSLQYNITGAELFHGEKERAQREITTNVVQKANVGDTLDESTTMADYIGELPGTNKHHFYLRGSKSDGTAFKKDIELSNDSTISNLLTSIGDAYGNSTNGVKVVNVSINNSGQIVVEDKIKGSSKIDFHMVGASDFNTTDSLPITDIDDLDSETTDYDTAVAAGDVLVTEFMKSGYTSAVSNTIEGILYDRTAFSVEGSTVSSNVPQIIKENNEYATSSTSLHEVFSGITYDRDGVYSGGLDSKIIKLTGEDISGNAYDVDINLLDSGSTFTMNGDTYDIFNMGDPRTATPAGEMRYQQLMDVVNLVTTGTASSLTPNTDTPPGSASDYDLKIENANGVGHTSLSMDGRIEFKDLNAPNTKAKIAMYDSLSDDFSISDGAISTFNTNNSITVTDPKTDMFKEIDEIITSVENFTLYPDSSAPTSRALGIENALSKLDDLQDHVFRSHSQVGAQSNTLSRSLERTQTLEISSMSLRSAVVDTDLAEASLNLAQLNTNYQAMLSTVGKVTKLSLVNYL